MFKKYQRYRWYAVFFASLLFLLLVVVGYVVPSVISIAEKINQIDQLRLKNEGLRTKIRVLDSFSASDLEEKYRFINVALLPVKDPYKIVTLFENVLQQIDPKNISLGLFRFQVGDLKNKKDTTIGDLVFEQSVTGEQKYLKDFVNLIENGYPVMTVKSFNGVFSTKTPINFRFVLHVYPENQQLPSIETPINQFTTKEIALFEEIKSLTAVFFEQEEKRPQKFGRTNPFAF